jgi:hypothetical protein
MRSFDRIFFAFAVLLYTSCANACRTDGEESSVNNSSSADSGSVQTVSLDSLPATDSVLPATASITTDSLPEILLNWEKELQKLGIKMSLDQFYAAGINEFSLYEQGSWDGVVRSNYVSSPDNRYYSYSVSSWNDGDADTYVHMIDKEKKKQYIVNVIGTCCTYEGTAWLDNHTIIAIGYDTDQAEERYPRQYLTQGLYCVFDLNTETDTYYRSRNFFARPCKCGPSSSE